MHPGATKKICKDKHSELTNAENAAVQAHSSASTSLVTVKKIQEGKHSEHANHEKDELRRSFARERMFARMQINKYEDCLISRGRSLPRCVQCGSRHRFERKHRSATMNFCKVTNAEKNVDQVTNAEKDVVQVPSSPTAHPDAMKKNRKDKHSQLDDDEAKVEALLLDLEKNIRVLTSESANFYIESASSSTTHAMKKIRKGKHSEDTNAEKAVVQVHSSPTVHPDAMKKIRKDKHSEPNDYEVAVVAELLYLEKNIPELTSELENFYIESVSVFFVGVKYAVVIHYPVKLRDRLLKIHSRLVSELEKFFKDKDVVFVARRRIMRPPKKGCLDKRVRSRIVTAMRDAELNDIIYPAEVIGKRIRYQLGGSSYMKVDLDKNVWNDTLGMYKLDTFAEVFYRLTRTRVFILHPDAKPSAYNLALFVEKRDFYEF